MFLRFIGYIFGMGMLAAIVVLGGIAWYINDLSKDLPSEEVLNSYEPPVTSRIHAADGSLMAEYARERRLFLPIQAVPDLVKHAVLSAEDKNFYEHPGIDFGALARAVATNIQQCRNGSPPDRRIDHHPAGGQELPAFERAHHRPQDQGSDPFAAHRAGLFEGPHPRALPQRDFPRPWRLWHRRRVADLFRQVGARTEAARGGLSGRLAEGAEQLPPVQQDQGSDRAAQLGHRPDGRERLRQRARRARLPRRSRSASTRGATANYLFAAEYFTEEVRREIIDRYGEDALYEGGLSVRTTLDPKLQIMARQALQNGLLEYDEEQGWRGPWKRFETVAPDWGTPAWRGRAAVATCPSGKWRSFWRSMTGRRTIGLRPSVEISGKLSEERAYRSHHLRKHEVGKPRPHQGRGKTAPPRPPAASSRLAMSFSSQPLETDGEYRLRQPPQVQGALVVMDPHTGRVLAMVGGFSYCAIAVQPRNAGLPPARLVVQAVRLCRSARQWLYAFIGGARCADLARPGRRPRHLGAEELRRRLCRSLDAARSASRSRETS